MDLEWRGWVRRIKMMSLGENKEEKEEKEKERERKDLVSSMMFR